MRFTRKQLRELDLNNYQIDTDEGHYFLQNGRLSLKRFAKRHGIDRRQINIMKIGVLFRDVKKAYLSGTDLETAVKAAIVTHCEPDVSK